MKPISIETILSKPVDNKVKTQAILYKGEVYTWFDSGLTRHVFVNADETKVIKLVIDERSRWNDEEHEIYENASEKVREELAKTEYSNGIIEQEFCRPIKMDERKLTIAQILFAKSCRNEVGWTKDGRLVCFDLDEYKKY